MVNSKKFCSCYINNNEVVEFMVNNINKKNNTRTMWRRRSFYLTNYKVK